jgi:hypothetical protein
VNIVTSVLKRRELLVEIGPEGWTPTQQPPELFTPFGYCYEATSSTRARKGKCGNA